MRSADATTLIRVALIVLVAYLILAKFNPIGIILLLAVALILDGVDGYLAVRDQSRGKISLHFYIRAALGNPSCRARVKKVKQGISKSSPYGARMDIAGDRATEYILWSTFVFLGIVPLFVLILVIIRHSFVDGVMAAKGTAHKMRTSFAARIYSSNLGRGGINVVKFLTFSYLVLVYVWGYPIGIGYALVGILLAYILLRGAAELYECFY
jgi:phosphatidylglycerophosphate synthase